MFLSYLPSPKRHSNLRYPPPPTWLSPKDPSQASSWRYSGSGVQGHPSVLRVRLLVRKGFCALCYPRRSPYHESSWALGRAPFRSRPSSRATFRQRERRPGTWLHWGSNEMKGSRSWAPRTCCTKPHYSLHMCRLVVLLGGELEFLYQICSVFSPQLSRLLGKDIKCPPISLNRGHPDPSVSFPGASE